MVSTAKQQQLRLCPDTSSSTTDRSQSCWLKITRTLANSTGFRLETQQFTISKTRQIKTTLSRSESLTTANSMNQSCLTDEKLRRLTGVRDSHNNFEDFQVSVQSAVRDDFDQVDKSEDVKENVLDVEDQDKDLVINDKQDKKLYELSKLTQFSRFVRVIITTQDEATFFIVLCDPNMPEYRISNMTSKKVLVYQKDAKERIIVMI